MLLVIRLVLSAVYAWPVSVFQHLLCIILTVFSGPGRKPTNIGVEPAEEAEEAKEVTEEEEKIGRDDEKTVSPCSQPEDIQYKPGQYLGLTSTESPQYLSLTSEPVSITELYCDDELSDLSPHLSDSNTHLDLSPLDCPLHLPLHLHHEDPHLTQNVILPFSVPSILQGSFQECSLDWGEV